MKLPIITSWRRVFLCLTLAVVFLAGLCFLVVLNKPSLIFHSLTEEEANRGREEPPDDNDQFLDQLICQRFGWHKLPNHSVQHEWYAGLFHHAEGFVIHLSPEEFADLKAHIDAELTKEPKQDQASKAAFSHDSPIYRFKWWTPPNKNAFSFWLGPDVSHEADGVWGTNGLMGSYTMEYDSESQLLYIDAGTV